ncbi:MAG: serine/threonine protein kinase [Phycisphaeraceae bacterium]|nr:serine/threonine protein kinase [Phycisphaeraceae bacterium]
MIRTSEVLVAEIRRLHRERRSVDLGAYFRQQSGLDDQAIADVIDADGHARIGRNEPVLIDLYLRSVDGLVEMPASLDTAIEIAIQSMLAQGMTQAQAVARLRRDHPDLEDAIQTAAALRQALWSTSEISRRVPRPAARTLPTDFGPVLATGERRYDLRERIGTGAHGSVYAAVDRNLSEDGHTAWVAIKILHAAPFETEVEEATKARRIDHPNVVRVIDRGITDDGEHYIVYEYVKGARLGSGGAAGSAPMDQRRAASLVASIARGVQAAHSVGIVHCDLKPANVLVSDEGVVRVTDFGIAARVDDDSDQGAPGADRELKGTLAFIAPEQYRQEEGARTPPADVYALGGLLYWLLTARLPNGESVNEVSTNLGGSNGRTAAPSPRAVRPGVDAALDAICRRALAPLPAERYGSADVLCRDLDAWLHHEPIGWTHPTFARRATLFLRRQPVIAGMAVLLAAALVALGAYAAVLSQRAARQRTEQALAASEQALAASEEQRREMQALQDRGREAIRATFAVMRATDPDKLEAGWLPTVTIMESMLGPLLVGLGEDNESRWNRRVEIVRRILSEAESKGQGRSLESLTWQTAQVYWLLQTGSFNEAESVGMDLQAKIAEVLAPDDPWHGRVAVIMACVRAQRLMAAKYDKSMPAEAKEQLRTQCEIIETIAEPVAGPYHPDPLKRAALKTLAEAYRAKFLRDPERLQSVQNRLQDVDK